MYKNNRARNWKTIINDTLNIEKLKNIFNFLTKNLFKN